MTIAVDLGRKAKKQTKPKMFEISGSKLKFRNLTFFFFGLLKMAFFIKKMFICF